MGYPMARQFWLEAGHASCAVGLIRQPRARELGRRKGKRHRLRHTQGKWAQRSDFICYCVGRQRPWLAPSPSARNGLIEGLRPNSIIADCSHHFQAAGKASKSAAMFAGERGAQLSGLLPSLGSKKRERKGGTLNLHGRRRTRAAFDRFKPCFEAHGAKPHVSTAGPRRPRLAGENLAREIWIMAKRAASLQRKGLVLAGQGKRHQGGNRCRDPRQHRRQECVDEVPRLLPS